MLNFD